MKGQKKQKDNSERYLLTYADMMNLLLILFIVLFATCSKDMVKMDNVMGALAKGFGGSSTAQSSSSKVSGTGAVSSKPNGTGNSSLKDDKVSNDYNEFYAQLLALLNNKNIKDKVDITDTRTEVIITLKDNVLFAPSKADLDSGATELLTNIADMLKEVSYGQLIIEGHTDSDPIHTDKFRDNTELSLTRAYTVSKIFTGEGINPKLVLPVGYGENFPVAPNDSVANKAKNRRVVITILKRGLTPADSTASASEISKRIEEIAKASSNYSEDNTSSKSSTASSSTSSTTSSQTSSK